MSAALTGRVERGDGTLRMPFFEAADVTLYRGDAVAVLRIISGARPATNPIQAPVKTAHHSIRRPKAEPLFPGLYPTAI